MDLGSELRTAREQRGLSLLQLSKATKIHPSALKAIEDNDFSQLPAGIFTRGFLRAYAREVGLDPAEVIREYDAELGRAPDSGASLANRAAATNLPQREISASAVKPVVYRSDHSGLVLAIAAAAVLLLTTYYVSDRSGNPRSAAHVQAERAAVAETNPPQPTTGASGRPESGTSGISDVTARPANEPSAAATAAAAVQDSALHVELEARDRPCWVSATADGVRVAYRLMQPGERQVIDARDMLVLRVGDPSAFAFSINGTPGASLGAPAVPVTIRIKPGHPIEFLSPQLAQPVS
jgi:cytoskeleton protein RodZ